MKLLLDSHTLIWSVEQPAKLGPTAVSALQDPGNALLLGAGTIWEIAIKVGLKKLTLSLPYRAWIEKATTDLGLSRKVIAQVSLSRFPRRCGSREIHSG